LPRSGSEQNKYYCTIQHASSCGSTTNAFYVNTSLLPSLEECLEPVEALPFHNNKISEVNRNAADVENGLSSGAPTPRAPPSISISGTDKTHILVQHCKGQSRIMDRVHQVVSLAIACSRQRCRGNEKQLSAVSKPRPI
jgi:hypothetical protein